MKKLTKIRLINWHMFRNSTIEINGNILLTGENGSGKSTLLDAIQYVLTAARARFNVAANENAKRSVSSYVRGKLGVEGHEFLRSGDITSHIALEFYDDEDDEYFVLGCVLELPDGITKVKNHFYALYNTPIKEFYLNEKKEPNSWKKFVTALKYHHVKKYHLFDTNKEASKAFLHILGVSKKYNELLPKALAFKPIDSLNKFIFDFLLNEDRINLESLKDNIRKYREFEAIIDDQKKRLEILSKLNEKKESYDKKNQEKDIRYILNDLIDFHMIERNYKQQLLKKDHLITQRNAFEKKVSYSKQEYDRLSQEVTNLQVILGNNETYKYQQDLMNKKKDLESLFKGYSISFDQFFNDYKKEIEILNKTKLNHDLNENIDYVLSDSNLYSKLNNLAKQIEDRKDGLRKSTFNVDNEIADKKNRLATITEDIKFLSGKKIRYRKEITELLNLLRRELSKIAKEEVDVRPLCEFLEIKDEKWRNALEGYLNTQRFDIIIEPKYFNYAIELYEQYKDEHGIYGVGIVDVAKLEKYSEVYENTLASLVDTKNAYARNYANMLLNRVSLEEDVKKLRNHKISITPTCMLYQNYTVRAINPKIFNTPFIGQKAIDVQLQQKQEESSLLEDELRKRIKVKSEYNRLLNHLKDSKMMVLSETCVDIVNTYKNTKNQLKDVNEKINDIKIDASLLALQDNLSEKEKEKNAAQIVYLNNSNLYHDCEKELNETECNISTISKTIEETREAKIQMEIDNVNILDQIDNKYNDLVRKTHNEFERMKRINENQINQLKDDIYEMKNNMKDIMHEFNRYTNIGLSESIDDISSYLNIYNTIRNIEMDEAKDKAQKARKKCEDSFQEDYISTLRGKFKAAKDEIKKLNNSLENRIFAKERYEFVIKRSDNQVFGQYYDIIMSGEDFNKDNLFVETLSENNRQIMLELFERISTSDSDSKNEKLLSEYTDYRCYMSYDIKIYHDNGTFTYFSKVNKEKSGGETQTPYYVTIAASFEQLLHNSRNKTSPGCLVLFDEAFNNMDETRIEEMMKFYNDLNIQLIIAVPPGRIQTITPYVETVLTLIKDENQIYIGDFGHEI